MCKSRREFLKDGTACALLGGISLASNIMDLGIFARIASAQTLNNDLKILVMVFQQGGIDSANALVRTDAQGYGDYKKARPQLGYNKSDLINLKYKDSSGAPVALSKHFKPIADLINSGKACAVANVGTTKRDLSNSNNPKADAGLSRLFSHEDQRFQWYTSSIDVKGTHGVLGRAQSVLKSFNNGGKFVTAISTSRSDLILRGDGIDPFQMTSDKVTVFDKGDSKGVGVLARMASFQTGNLLENSYSDLMNRTLTESNGLASILNPVTTGNIIKSTSNLAQQCKRAVNIIDTAMKGGFGDIKRMTLFIQDGGWDTHKNQNAGYTLKANDFSTSISEFYNALTSIGAAKNTTIFTGSDFGRTGLESVNASDKKDPSKGLTVGTDHGWGGHYFVIGDSVKPGVYGSVPSLREDYKYNIGRSVSVPTISCDQYFATLGKWYGVPSGEMNSVFKNLRNFSTKDIGFMKA